MKHLNSMTIKTRLITGFSIIIFFVFLIAVASLGGLSSIVNDISLMFDSSARMQRHSFQALVNMTKCRQYEKDIFLKSRKLRPLSGESSPT